MSETYIKAVLVVGHGSRREEANEDVRQAALGIAERGRFPLVVAAFLEIAQPTIAEGFARLVEMGAKHIVVHPYFLSPGRHTHLEATKILVTRLKSEASAAKLQVGDPVRVGLTSFTVLEKVSHANVQRRKTGSQSPLSDFAPLRLTARNLSREMEGSDSL